MLSTLIYTVAGIHKHMHHVRYDHHLFETTHEVIADWGTGQVSSAGAASHVEEVI